MAYFPDLSAYSYFKGRLPIAKNVGWLERGHDFETMAPAKETLDQLWSFLSVSAMQTRGIHRCDLCRPQQMVHAVRNGVRRSLGSAEVRVFSREPDKSLLVRRLGELESGGLLFVSGSAVPFSIFAAPTLIYHYVETHHYKPPDEFLRAMQEGPRPPAPAYFECLKKTNLYWK